MITNTINNFKLDGKISVITGGAGFLGEKHAEAILEGGGIPVLVDINESAAKKKAEMLSKKYDSEVHWFITDLTKKESIINLNDSIISEVGYVDILINNAANDPKVDAGKNPGWSRFENFPEENWDLDFAVGLKGAFFCCQVIGQEMAKRKQGVILNISSDLGIIAPDQSIYSINGLSQDLQPVKPVTYSVVKHGLIGLTKYLATYWARDGVRVNSLCPGGIYNKQPESFTEKVERLIPMGRMANADEYKSAVLFMVSDASTYMTGSTIIVDGGRTCW